MKNEESNSPIVFSKKQKSVVIGLCLAIIVVIGLTYQFKKVNKPLKTTQEEEYHLPETPAKFTLPVIEQVSKENTEQKKQQAELSEVELKQKMTLIQAEQKALQQRLSAPLIVVNQNALQHIKEDKNQHIKSDDANTQFMQTISQQSVEVVEAKTMGALSQVIAQGRLIHATLETAINSDLPGYLRAMVNQPVFAEDGSRILIPKGSRLIGQYKSSLAQGQSRVFIVWSRLITPRGISLNLSAPGVDSLGMAGMGADHINRHFWQRFGQATLLSLIGSGTDQLDGLGDEKNVMNRYRDAIAASFSQSANQALQQDGRIAPTLTIKQGQPIMVFVARDVHFPNDQSLQHKINIF